MAYDFRANHLVESAGGFIPEEQCCSYSQQFLVAYRSLSTVGSLIILAFLVSKPTEKQRTSKHRVPGTNCPNTILTPKAQGTLRMKV